MVGPWRRCLEHMLCLRRDGPGHRGLCQQQMDGVFGLGRQEERAGSKQTGSRGSLLLMKLTLGDAIRKKNHRKSIGQLKEGLGRQSSEAWRLTVDRGRPHLQNHGQRCAVERHRWDVSAAVSGPLDPACRGYVAPSSPGGILHCLCFCGSLTSNQKSGVGERKTKPRSPGYALPA